MKILEKTSAFYLTKTFDFRILKSEKKSGLVKREENCKMKIALMDLIVLYDNKKREICPYSDLF